MPGHQSSTVVQAELQALLLCTPACMQAASGCVRLKGPDPRLAKASGRAFHQAKEGITTISASGAAHWLTLGCTVLLGTKSVGRLQALSPMQTKLLFAWSHLCRPYYPLSSRSFAQGCLICRKPACFHQLGKLESKLQ